MPYRDGPSQREEVALEDLARAIDGALDDPRPRQIALPDLAQIVIEDRLAASIIELREQNQRVHVAAPDLRSPHPIRDGTTTSAAIVLLALGAFVATRKQGTGAEARPKSGGRRWLRRL
jgi:hypothetical protein